MTVLASEMWLDILCRFFLQDFFSSGTRCLDLQPLSCGYDSENHTLRTEEQEVEGAQFLDNLLAWPHQS